MRIVFTRIRRNSKRFVHRARGQTYLPIIIA
jgi:hypothetical protein